MAHAVLQVELRFDIAARQLKADILLRERGGQKVRKPLGSWPTTGWTAEDHGAAVMGMFEQIEREAKARAEADALPAGDA